LPQHPPQIPIDLSYNDDSEQEIAHDVRVVSRVEAIPTLLQVLCDSTGMGFAAVARVTEGTWTACAVQDRIDFGLKPGGQLPVATTLCSESRAGKIPIIIDHASTDPVYAEHHTPRIYNIESYVSVPIVFADGRYFGNLCAIDPRPAQVSDPKIVSMFTRFAQLIALQLQNEFERERDQAALLDERAIGELREQFMAILGHDLRNPLQAFFAGCDFLIRKIEDQASLRVVARMKANAQRMSGLISDVLDFARGRLGQSIGVTMTESRTLGSSLGAVVHELQDAQPNRQVVADIRIDQPVYCDEPRIQQVASNLLANALAHGSSAEPVRFSATLVGDALVLQVWNQGEPIAPDNIGKIFSPFWRHSTSASREGLGLGLHICSQIIAAHHGALNVVSTQSDGTLFTATIPSQPKLLKNVPAH
jgi:signal transduction histidine kinase